MTNIRWLARDARISIATFDRYLRTEIEVIAEHAMDLYSISADNGWTGIRHVGGQRVIAIDGKTVRGARSAHTVAPHLIAALDHATGVVLGQEAVAAKSNEIPAVRTCRRASTPTISPVP